MKTMRDELTLRDNVVWCDKNDFIHAVFHGEQTLEKLRGAVWESQQLCEELVKSDKPILMIADIRDIGAHRPEARLIGMRARAQLPFWRLAIVTSDIENETTTVSLKLTAMSSRKQEIGYFSSLPKAYAWLNELAG